MTFAEKLTLLLRKRTARDVASQASVSPTSITNYLRRASIPRADAAFRLARVLDVDLTWLLDDAANWPAPSAFRHRPAKVA